MKTAGLKLSFQRSQYSGPLSTGRINYRSRSGMPHAPAGMKVAGPPPPPEEGDHESEDTAVHVKEASLWKAAAFAIGAIGAHQKAAK